MEYTLQTILKKPVLVHAYKRTRFGKVEEDYLVGKFSWFLVTRLFQSSRCNSKGGTAIPPFFINLRK